MLSLRAVAVLPFQSKLWCLWKFFNHAPKSFGTGNIGLLSTFLMITSFSHLWLGTHFYGLDVGINGERPILSDYIQWLYGNTALWYLLTLCPFLWHYRPGCLPFLHGQSSATKLRLAHTWKTLPSDRKSLKKEEGRKIQTKMDKYVISTQDFKIISLFSTLGCCVPLLLEQLLEGCGLNVYVACSRAQRKVCAETPAEFIKLRIMSLLR